MQKSILVSCLLLTVVYTFSQEKKKDTLGTEEINVVRPYSPTVSDAFKIKSTPRINDSELNSKKQIRYSIFSVPVASTFTPAKGKAKVLRIDPSAPIYENYISAGFGTFKTPVLEAFVHTNSTKYNDFGGFFNFLSSNGGVKDALLNTDYIDSAIDLFYNQDDRYYNWQVTGGIRYQKYNWYGLPKEINFTNAVIDGISEKLNYTDIHLGGKLDYEDSFFQGGTASLYHFTDNEASSETHLRANPKVEFPVGDEFINATGRLEYLGGSFYTNYDNSNDITYGFINAGVQPNLEIVRDRFSANLGADLVYSIGTGSGAESKFYAYPNINASFVLIDQVATLFAGVDGKLQQNSFKGFTSENPFMSPTLDIKRTDEQYNAYGGIKGQLASNISYNFKGSYKSERDKPLYKLNPSKTDGTTEVIKGYEAGNSFGVVYDNVKTISATAEVQVDFSKAVQFGGTVAYNIYEPTAEPEAWNLPALEITGYGKISVDKWFAGGDLFFVGQRYDELVFSDNTVSKLKLGNYIDLNFNAGYKFTDQLNVFARVNNVLNSRYQKFANYNVQGLQFLAGLTYKFDL